MKKDSDAVIFSAMGALANLIDNICTLYIWAVVLATVLSWLAALDIVNASNQFIRVMADFLYRITEPLLAPIRRILPHLGSVDISPLILILLILFIRDLLVDFLASGIF